ncbi:condensation domain-containing protein [Gryllotalpicola reticulitermitis]|uniref:Condensation domain-containing protein n=1 Tax=Gryllotalpicola reticulitermitis TaxID=1184153 RepID=A0ABV8QA89_9MICO
MTLHLQTACRPQMTAVAVRDSSSPRYAAAPAQADVWLADHVRSGSLASTMSLEIVPPRKVGLALVEAAVNHIVLRHSILRSQLCFDDDGLWVRPESSAPRVVHCGNQMGLLALADIGPESLVPWQVWTSGPDASQITRLVFRFHHAYVDGESAGRVVREFITYCDGGADRASSTKSTDYRIYAERMNDIALAPPDGSRAYWATLNLDGMWAASATRQRAFPTGRAEIGPDTADRIERRARTMGLTFFALALAATARVVQQRLNEPAVFSIPVSQRFTADYADLVGQCTELCPILVSPSEQPFDECARSLYFSFLDALSHLLPMVTVRRLTTPSRHTRLDAVTVTMLADLADDRDWTVSSLDDDSAGRPLAVVFRRSSSGLSVVVRRELDIFGSESLADEILDELRRCLP